MYIIYIYEVLLIISYNMYLSGMEVEVPGLQAQ